MVKPKSKYARGKHPNSRNSPHLFQKGHKYYGGEEAKKTQFKEGHKIRVGMEHSEESKKLIGEVQIGRKASEKTKKKMSETSKKVPHDGWFKKGFIPWNKGKEFPQIKGEKHFAWQGGKSFETYTKDFNEKLKELMRERDNKLITLKCC